MNNNDFNPSEYYALYPDRVIARPGYPARAAYKSTLMFKSYGDFILNDLGKIDTYADIGGCFGFGANTMKFHISRKQEIAPRTFVFELSSKFTSIGKILFPDIEFVQEDFFLWKENVKSYDLITLFDVLEHVVDPESFLRKLAERCKFLMLKTPMETTGEFMGSKPPVLQGEKHIDGHINFFTPASYEKLLNSANLEILKSRLVYIIPRGAQQILNPEQEPSTIHKPLQMIARTLRTLPGVPWSLKRKILGGGDHICLCRTTVE